MIRLYHGTTTEAYCSILKNGFCHKEVVWTCSDSNMLYFYSDELIAKEFELDEQEAINKCCEMALQSAAFSAAVTNNTYRAFYVFEFLIDEEYWYIIKTDGSMKKSSACSVCIEANLLKKLTHNVYCAPEHYTSRLAFFISVCWNRIICQNSTFQDLKKYYRAFNPIVLGFIPI